MRVLIDICHPAHAHFFRNPIEILKSRGHELLITSRVKEMATELLDEMGIPHHPMSSQANGSVIGLLGELALRDFRLYRIVRRYRPDVMAAIGGTFISHVGFVSSTPALTFYDTENARLQNALTYPFSSLVYVPECYRGWVLQRRTRRYRGYHELSYLHPKYFRPNREIALANGLAPEGETFLVRLVSWKANHDIGERGWSLELLRSAVRSLAPHGHVLISSEAVLPEEFKQHRYTGDANAIHHVIAYCRGYVGESATMASEAAVLGVAAVYAARTGRGYTDEQESVYGLVKNVRVLDPRNLKGALNWMMSLASADRKKARDRILADSVDVAEFVADEIEAWSTVAATRKG